VRSADFVRMETLLDEPEVALSIIVPMLNERRMIAATLQPLQVLRKQGVEIIVCDGGSLDSGPAIAAPLADKVVRCLRGRAKQMNRGAELARGQYLLFLHADTLLPGNFHEIYPNWDEKAIQWGFFKLRLSGQGVGLRIIEYFINFRSRKTCIGTGDQALFIHRDLFQRLDGFADIPLMEDVEFCKRLRQYSTPVWQDTGVETSSRRWEKRGLLKTVWLMWLLRLAYALGVAPEKLAQRYSSM